MKAPSPGVLALSALAVIVVDIEWYAPTITSGHYPDDE